MCVSISGRCFMSQYAYGKSANRGECLQPCRREYSVKEKRENGAEFAVGEGFVMSPKDLCTLPFVEKLFEAGADALKIEGRNRNAQYVSAAAAHTAPRGTSGSGAAAKADFPKSSRS